MNKQRLTSANKKKQKESVKKFKLKKKVKTKPKSKTKKKKMVTYSIAVRKKRDRPWVVTSDFVTASSKILATHIAAHRNPSRWVKVLS